MICKYCGFNNVVKNGKIRGKQSYLCKDRTYRFTIATAVEMQKQIEKPLIVIAK